MAFSTKMRGNHHSQGNVQVYNVRIPVTDNTFGSTVRACSVSILPVSRKLLASCSAVIAKGNPKSWSTVDLGRTRRREQRDNPHFSPQTPCFSPCPLGERKKGKRLPGVRPAGHNARSHSREKNSSWIPWALAMFFHLLQWVCHVRLLV